MKSIVVTAGLAIGAIAVPAGSAAQTYGQGAAQPAPRAPAQPASEAPAAEKKRNVSPQAMKAIRALQSAVEANDRAAIPARLAEAQTAAKTADERYIVAQFQLNAAIAANDNAAVIAAIESMLATGGAEAAGNAALHLNLAKANSRLKQYDKAAAAYERVLALDPNNVDALVSFGESRSSQGRPAEAVALLRRAIQVRKASGQPVESDWYRRTLGIAVDAKLPVGLEVAREWLAAYPTPANWSDALRAYRGLASPDPETVLDTMRLARTARALTRDTDFQVHAATAINEGAIAEAKAVLAEAPAANVDLSKPMFNQINAALKTKAAGNRAAADAAAKSAAAGAAAAPAVKVADALYGLGAYAEAAQLYRAALGKSGADASHINLHLGMALARAGDKAGAATAFNAVTGPRAELAKFWLVYVAAAG
jgi:tetratricopeptide (TPR) repeat protein